MFNRRIKSSVANYSRRAGLSTFAKKVAHSQIKRYGLSLGGRSARASLASLLIVFSSAHLALTTYLSPTVAQSNSPKVWDLASDLRRSFKTNPSADSFGNNKCWHFMQSPTLAHNPATYIPLPTYKAAASNVQGLLVWQGNAVQGDPRNIPELPLVGINTTGSLQNVTSSQVSWPDGEVLMHPSKSQFAIVGWRSPVDGTITITGGVTGLDAHSGDGVAWYIDRNEKTLAHGAIRTAESQNFQAGDSGNSLSSVAVRIGDFLYFIVDPNGDYHFDSTGLKVTITLLDGYEKSRRQLKIVSLDLAMERAIMQQQIAIRHRIEALEVKKDVVARRLPADQSVADKAIQTANDITQGKSALAARLKSTADELDKLQNQKQPIPASLRALANRKAFLEKDIARLEAQPEGERRLDQAQLDRDKVKLAEINRLLSKRMPAPSTPQRGRTS